MLILFMNNTFIIHITDLTPFLVSRPGRFPRREAEPRVRICEAQIMDLPCSNMATPRPRRPDPPFFAFAG